MDIKKMLFPALAGLIILACLAIVIGIPLLFIASQVVFPQQCVAVVKLSGPIVAGSSPSGLFAEEVMASDDAVALIKQAQDDANAKAIVLEINSPGGSVVGTREIYDQVKASDKPTVAYFREVAASGGYYVAAGTDYIVANPDTLTGSIGVTMSLQEYSGLFEKLGINFTSVTSGGMKDIGSPYRPMTEEERVILQSLVDETFQGFRDIVVENRGDRLDSAAFNQILDGRVLSGRQAYRAGLVDALGNRQNAIDKAGGLAGIEGEPNVCEIGADSSIFQKLLGSSLHAIGTAIGQALSPSMGARPTLSY